MQPLLAAGLLIGVGRSSYVPNSGREPLAFGRREAGALACERGGAAPPPHPPPRPPRAATPAADSRARSVSPAELEQSSAQRLEGLRRYVSCIGGHGPHGSVGRALLDGWVARSEVRKAGSTAGTVDTYFFNPEGKKFRSRVDVARFLGLEPPAPPPKKRQKADKGGGGAQCGAPA